MRQFFTLSEIATAMGVTNQAASKLAAVSGWRHQDGKARKREGRGGGWEYHLSLLSQGAQSRLMLVHGAPANSNTSPASDARAKLWAVYESLSKDRKAACEARLNAVAQVAALISCGITETAAIAMVSRTHKVSPRAVRNWGAAWLE